MSPLATPSASALTSPSTSTQLEKTSARDADKGVHTWQARAAAHRQSTYNKIPIPWRLSESQLAEAKKQIDLTGPFIEKFLTTDEVAITRTGTMVLLAKMRTGVWTARRVTEAFCRRAAVGQQMNNCLHEIFFDQALEGADALDKHFKEHGTTVGPLHGLPISLKDQFHVKDVDTSMGFIGWLGTYEGYKTRPEGRNEESQLVSDLRGLGAVFYCKTSLPQTLILGETINNLIGSTMNPINMKLSCGGSSGGEGALAALGASPVGVGTDIGGSVRIPAAFCGITSIKPSHNRVSYRDVANTNPGQTTYASSVGFMSPTLDSLRFLLQSVLATSPWLRDPCVISLPWREDIVSATLARASADGSAHTSTSSSDHQHVSSLGESLPANHQCQIPLKLGVMCRDDMITPHPPIQRGSKLVINAVRKAGHKVVDWDPPSHAIAQKIHESYLFADGSHDVQTQIGLSGEPLIPPLASAFKPRDPMNIVDYQALTIRGRDFEGMYSDYWNRSGDDDGQLVDAVIMPVAPHAAVIPGKFWHTAYTESINLLDYTAVAIPITRADKHIDRHDVATLTPMSDRDKRHWDTYDPDMYHGAPVGLQLVGRKYEEEKVWAIAKIVERILEREGIE